MRRESSGVWERPQLLYLVLRESGADRWEHVVTVSGKVPRSCKQPVESICCSHHSSGSRVFCLLPAYTIAPLNWFINPCSIETVMQ